MVQKNLLVFHLMKEMIVSKKTKETASEIVEAEELVAFGEDDILQEGDGDVITVDERSGNVREEVLGLKKEIEFSYFTLADKLFEISKNEYYKDYGFKSFWEYCSQELGIEKRKAQYLLSIYKFFQNLIEEGYKGKVEQLKQIGWTKVKEICSIPQVNDNLDYWINEARKSSVRDLISIKKSYEEELKAETTEGGSTETKEPITKPKDVDNKTKFAVSFYNEQYATVTEAMSLAEKKIGNDSKSKIIEVLAQSFIANESDDLDKSLSAVESSNDINIIAIKDGEIVYGQELLDKINIEA